jgi:hypothetical protein
VLVAERLQSGKHRVDLGLPLHEGGQRIIVRSGLHLAGPGDHLGLHWLSEPMNASSGILSQRKID